MNGTAEPAYRKRIGYQAILLGGMALLTGALLVLGNDRTAAEIARRQAEDVQTSLRQVIPDSLHDNDMLKDQVTLQVQGDDGLSHPQSFFLARKGGRTKAVAYEITGQGYGGAIKILMAVDRDGNILGVRVLAHSETPGLGDKIELKKSHWVLEFNHKSLQNLTRKQWHVKKDGGVFDQFTGATITPRGVVKAVHAGLEMFRKERSALLAPAAPTSETAQ